MDIGDHVVLVRAGRQFGKGRHHRQVDSVASARRSPDRPDRLVRRIGHLMRASSWAMGGDSLREKWTSLISAVCEGSEPQRTRT